MARTAVSETIGPLERRVGGMIARPAILPLLLVIGIAWVIVVLGPDGMGMGLAVFVAAWTIMMAAMMLPSAAPLVLLYGRGASARAPWMLGAGYLAVWAVAGIPAYAAHELLPMTVSPFALAAAGVYQLTPVKASCLKRCRTPADFLVQRWGRGPFRIGLEHGAWCLGCCWALMAVLVLVGMMGLVWVVGLTAVVAMEKVSPHGPAWARVAGVAFLIAAIVEVVQ